MAAGGSRAADLGKGADPELTLTGSRVTVEPGGQKQLSLRVRNPGRIVETYRLDVVGLDAGWWQVLPPEVDVDAGAEASATVVLSPPSGARAGEHPQPFGVRVVSLVDPNRSVVEEGDLEVGRVLELVAQLRPVTARARWRAQFRLTFRNWGNAPVRLVLTATDPDDLLGFSFSQDKVAVPIGGSATVRLKVRPRRPFLRGTPVRLPFTVTGEPPGSTAGRTPPRTGAAAFAPPDPSRPVLDGVVDQRPILSRGLVAAALLVVVPLALLVGYVIQQPGVNGAKYSDTKPDRVTGVGVKPLGADTMQVSWERVERVTGYRVQFSDPKTKALGESQEVKGGDVSFHNVKVDPAGGKVCFVVQAVRGTYSGELSKPKCATPTGDTLPAPKGVEASFTSQGGLDVRWEPQEGLAHRVLLDGVAEQPDVPAGGSRMQTKPVPAGNGCVNVTVIAVDGDRLSELDAEGASKCVERPDDGAGEPGATGPTTTGSGPSEGATLSPWVAHYGPFYQQGDQQAEDKLAKAIEAGLDPEHLVLATHADLPADQGMTDTSLALVYDGFPDEQSAATFCDENPVPELDCTALETGW